MEVGFGRPTCLTQKDLLLDDRSNAYMVGESARNYFNQLRVLTHQGGKLPLEQKSIRGLAALGLADQPADNLGLHNIVAHVREQSLRGFIGLVDPSENESRIKLLRISVAVAYIA